MAFIRLSDDYIDNPKFTRLTDGAFRLWHEALAYCRRHLTDGLFNFATMRGFRYYTRGRERQLSETPENGTASLWVLVPKFGYRLHDYLSWNLSKEEEAADREGAADRMRKLRKRRKEGNAHVDETPSEPPRDGVTGGGTSAVTNAVRSGDGDGHSVFLKKEKELPVVNARSNRPIFKGTRFVVFEWQFDDLCRMLGDFAEDFHIDEWFHELNRRADQGGQVIPQRDGGAWLQAQTLAEAQRRGLPIAVASAPGVVGNKRVTGLVRGGEAFLNRVRS